MSEQYLMHHGVLGQKWGVRRYQNEDGSYKYGAEGRYNPSGSHSIAKQTKNVTSYAIRNVKANGLREGMKRNTAAAVIGVKKNYKYAKDTVANVKDTKSAGKLAVGVGAKALGTAVQIDGIKRQAATLGAVAIGASGSMALGTVATGNAFVGAATAGVIGAMTLPVVASELAIGGLERSVGTYITKYGDSKIKELHDNK